MSWDNALTQFKFYVLSQGLQIVQRLNYNTLVREESCRNASILTTLKSHSKFKKTENEMSSCCLMKN